MSTSTATRLRPLSPRPETGATDRPRLVLATPGPSGTTDRTTARSKGGASAGRTAASVRPARQRPASVHRLPARGVTSVRRGVHLTSRGRVLLVLVLAALLLGAFAIGRSASSQATTVTSTPAAATTQVTVQSGDTLWSLAQRLAPEQDTRKVVDQLRRLNHLRSASDLKAGQQLLLPAVV